MKVDAGKFYKFVKKASLTGTIPAIILKIDKNVVTAKTMDLTTVVGVMATAKFFKTDVVENWAIKDTGLFLKILELFKDSGEVEIIRNENKLSIYNKDWQLEYTLAQESFVEQDMAKDVELKKLTTQGVNISSDVFKDIAKVISKGLTGKDSTSIIVKFDSTSLTLINGGKESDTVSRKVAVPYHDAKSKFSNLLCDIIAVIDDKINVNVENDYPMMISESDPDYDIKYFIAPLIENKE